MVKNRYSIMILIDSMTLMLNDVSQSYGYGSILCTPGCSHPPNDPTRCFCWDIDLTIFWIAKSWVLLVNLMVNDG